jgi:hypothetical protein
MRRDILDGRDGLFIGGESAAIFYAHDSMAMALLLSVYSHRIILLFAAAYACQAFRAQDGSCLRKHCTTALYGSTERQHYSTALCDDIVQQHCTIILFREHMIGEQD